jgi:hypothetical protein
MWIKYSWKLSRIVGKDLESQQLGNACSVDKNTDMKLEELFERVDDEFDAVLVEVDCGRKQAARGGHFEIFSISPGSTIHVYFSLTQISLLFLSNLFWRL